jgi:hypothetical protein
MSHRHLQRQSDRDVRMHDPPAHPHPHVILTHPVHPATSAHPPHLNGNATALPTTPALSNGSSHAHTASNQIVSPVVVPNAPASNGIAPAPSSIIHKLAVANEQTWLLIGKHCSFSKPGNNLNAFLSQGVSRSKWVTLNMRSRHMKTLYGTTRCPCQDLHK